MDTIFIRDLSLRGKHGVHAEERQVEQEFLIDIEVSCDTKKAAESDDLDDTLNYVRFREIARDVVESESHFLIERIADRIASRILEDTRIAQITVTIRKPAVFESGVPGVTIVRTRA